jgi:hypothetical protein
MKNNRLFNVIAPLWAVALIVANLAWFTSGCTGLNGRPKSVEEVTFETIRDSQDAVQTALAIYNKRAAKATVNNEKTQQSDPGGYLDRQRALTIRHGKVERAIAEYQAAVNAQIAAWKGVDGSLPDTNSITVNTAVASALQAALKVTLDL